MAHFRNNFCQADLRQAGFQRSLGFFQRLFQRGLDVATHGTGLLLGITVNGKRLGRIHGLINVPQRDGCGIAGSQQAPALPVAVSTKPALDNRARVRRTKLGLVFTLAASRADVVSCPHRQASPAIRCTAIAN